MMSVSRLDRFPQLLPLSFVVGKDWIRILVFLRTSNGRTKDFCRKVSDLKQLH